MIGARLADLRDWNNQTQEELAKALNVATSTIRSWEHEKSSPNHEMLIAICRYYGTSADYLLGLTDIDPSDEARKQRQRLTEDEPVSYACNPTSRTMRYRRLLAENNGPATSWSRGAPPESTQTTTPSSPP